MEAFLKDNFKISTKTCTVVEEAVLKAAQASLGKQGTCSMYVGGDQSRMVFNFVDMDKENAAKVVSYFQQLGDKTAIEGYGGRAYGSYVPEAAMTRSMPGTYPSEPKVRLEEHSIEVDGTFLYKTLFPELKAGFGFLEADADKLKELQAASRNCWDPRVWSRAKPTEPVDETLQNTIV